MAQQTRNWQPVTLGADAKPPAGAYSPGVRAGQMLFVSGQIPRDPRTGEIVGTDIVTQSRRTLENVRAVLESGGAKLEDVVSVTVYLANDNDWGEFNTVYKSVFSPPYPARAVVGAGLRGILVEVSAIAMVSNDPDAR
jgi:2-iminobutanoate/2-iminopropanoate deaminase